MSSAATAGGPPVFDTTNRVRTSTPVPQAGSDNHALISGNDSAWRSVEERAFCGTPVPGQEQTLVGSADQTFNVQNNQYTTVNKEIVIESRTSRIHIKAAEEITLEVGKSKLYMDKAGKIQLTGVDILSEAETHHTIKGGRVDINP